MIVVYSSILSLIFTEISPHKTPHYGASGMGMHCLPMSSLKIIVSYPLRKHNENEKNGGKKIINHMYNETIQPLETNAQYFGWGRVCKGPSLSGAEMSRNPT